uniref:(northern house mosquito) hypothetical protein n=1 Tax=Culex pipiens TaxID=7175 RepID=A0A8D8F2P3_CULPI
MVCSKFHIRDLRFGWTVKLIPQIVKLFNIWQFRRVNQRHEEISKRQPILIVPREPWQTDSRQFNVLGRRGGVGGLRNHGQGLGLIGKLPNFRLQECFDRKIFILEGTPNVGVSLRFGPLFLTTLTFILTLILTSLLLAGPLLTVR